MPPGFSLYKKRDTVIVAVGNGQMSEIVFMSCTFRLSKTSKSEVVFLTHQNGY